MLSKGILGHFNCLIVRNCKSLLVLIAFYAHRRKKTYSKLSHAKHEYVACSVLFNCVRAVYNDAKLNGFVVWFLLGLAIDAPINSRLHCSSSFSSPRANCRYAIAQLCTAANIFDISALTPITKWNNSYNISHNLLPRKKENRKK